MNLMMRVLALILCLVQLASSLRFHLAPNGKRCLKEEIHKLTLVKGEYEMEEVNGQETVVKVRSHVQSQTKIMVA